MIISLEGYHGTSLCSGKSIIKNSYIASISDREWLGDGVYFFTEGINNNVLNLAKEWSIAQSWDNKNRNYKYNQYCILKSLIEVHESNFLDLTQPDGVTVFEYLKDKLLEKMKKANKKIRYLDGYIINFARKEKIIPIDVAKGNFFIKFTKERKYAINQRTNNCTICAVYENTNIKHTEVIKTGNIQ